MTDIEIVNISKSWRERPELTQYQIAQYYRTLLTDGLIESCFYDGSVQNYVDFFSFCLDRLNLFLIVYERNTQKPLAHVTLNCFEGYACRIHFGMTREAHGRHKSLDIAAQSVGEIFRMTRYNDQTPLTRTLVGVTPTRNRLACQFIQELGFTPVATISQCCRYAKGNTFSDGLMTILTKEQFEEAPNGWKNRPSVKTSKRV